MPLPALVETTLPTLPQWRRLPGSPSLVGRTSVALRSTSCRNSHLATNQQPVCARTQEQVSTKADHDSACPPRQHVGRTTTVGGLSHASLDQCSGQPARPVQGHVAAGRERSPRAIGSRHFGRSIEHIEIDEPALIWNRSDQRTELILQRRGNVEAGLCAVSSTAVRRSCSSATRQPLAMAPSCLDTNLEVGTAHLVAMQSLPGCGTY